MIKALVPLLFVAMPAFAEDIPANCAPERKAMVERLGGNISEQGYEESQMAVMYDTKRETLVELYGNPKSGTWTLLSTRPDGVTCIEAGGFGFQAFPYRPAGEDL
jgi:hypothetical protein